MDGSKVDPDQLRRRLERLVTWEDWYRLERELFEIESWCETPEDLSEALLERSDVMLGESLWRPLAIPYQISSETMIQHQEARWRAFEILDPEGAEENRLHPEFFGQACYRCQRYCRQAKLDRCPNCAGVLVPIPLGENQD